MRVLSLLAALLIGSFAVFVFVGLPAQRRADAARDALAQRIDDTAALERRMRLVSEGDVERLLDDRDRVRAVRDAWIEALVGRDDGEPSASFDERLAASRQPGLAPDTELARTLGAQAQASPRDAALLAALLGILDRAEVADVVGLELGTPGAWAPLPNVPDLVAARAQLTVVGGLEETLECLESLVPGEGLPILSIASATIRRVEPEGWGRHLKRMSSPPVRLSVTIEAMLPATEDGLR